MAELPLYFRFDPQHGTSSVELQDKLQSSFKGMPEVESTQVPQRKSRITGLEILAAITIATQVVHNAKQIAEDVQAIAASLKKIFDTVRQTATELKASAVDVSVDGERKSIFELSDKDYLTLAKDVAVSAKTQAAK